MRAALAAVAAVTFGLVLSCVVAAGAVGTAESLIAVSDPGAKSAETQVGPARGTLMIVGGDSMAALWPTFFALAGGNDAPIVVIPTAGEMIDSAEKTAAQWRALGATHVTQLHTTDRQIADSEEFSAPLRATRAVWIAAGASGGWRMPISAHARSGIFSP